MFSRVINIRYWSDFDRTKSISKYLMQGIGHIFTPRAGDATESFDEAMKRQNISEEQIQERKKALYRLTMIMLTAALLLFGYSIYQMIHGSFKAMGVSLVVMMIAFVLAFRYHFWYFQIKVRKLGCSFQEWYKHGFKGEKL